MRHTNIKKRSAKTGMDPGTLVHVGEDRTAAVSITVMEYGPDSFAEKKINIDELTGVTIPDDSVLWVNIDGIHDLSVVEKLGAVFKIHNLHLEDLLNTTQRPKTDSTDDYLFVVMKMLHIDNSGVPVSEQVSIILGERFVLTFQEDDGGDSFDGVRTRLRTNRTAIRRMKADFLFYALIDSLVDMYFVIIEDISNSISLLEDEVIVNPGKGTSFSILALKKEIMFLNRAVWPLREIIRSVERINTGIISPPTLVYLKDVSDHIFEISETILFSQELLSSLMDIYLSNVNNRMNEVMKVLTVMSSIFIPLTFLVGVYGMNFDNMPELRFKYGYFVLVAIMIIIAVTLFLIFRRKKWI
jgi:magnesium transporter